MSGEELNRRYHELNAVIGGPLNPEWCEWYMGYPAGWTDCADSEMPLCRKSQLGSETESLSTKDAL